LDSNKPIGIFDSGLGGLTVVKAIRKELPNEAIVYFGDTARVPYGNKSSQLIKEYSSEIAEFLLKHDTKIIIIACNTATALALKSLEKQLCIPVVGVIKPGVSSALKRTRNNHIGVIGTIATINAGVYRRSLKHHNNKIKVTSTPCPLFVPLAEEGWLNEPATKLIAKKYLQAINDASADTVILGCTHYPILTEVIKSVLSPQTILVDSAKAVAIDTAKLLKENRLLGKKNAKGTLRLFVSDLPARFEDIATRFLGEEIPNVRKIRLGRV